MCITCQSIYSALVIDKCKCECECIRIHLHERDEEEEASLLSFSSSSARDGAALLALSLARIVQSTGIQCVQRYLTSTDTAYCHYYSSFIVDSLAPEFVVSQ